MSLLNHFFPHRFLLIRLFQRVILREDQQERQILNLKTVEMSQTPETGHLKLVKSVLLKLFKLLSLLKSNCLLPTAQVC